MIRCKPGSTDHSHGWLTEGGQQQAGAESELRELFQLSEFLKIVQQTLKEIRIKLVCD